MTRCNRRCADHLDEQPGTQFRMLGEEKKTVRPMPLKARRQAHHAEVAECVIFTTRNSLKSHVVQNIKSPLLNIRAGTSKLCRCSRPR